MNHRFCLFYSGFTSFAPSLYFNQKALLNKLELELDNNQKARLDKYLSASSDSEDEYFSYIKTAASLATYFEMDPQVKPETPDEYFTWLKEYTEAFERKFPMTKIDHYYFLFARKIAEIVFNTRRAIALIDLGLDFDTSREFGFLDKANKNIKDTEYIVFKLVASAALLSSESRHGFINTFYKEMNKEYENFRRVDLLTMKTNDIKQLKKGLENYHTVVMNGFKNSINSLKELGI